MKAFPKRRAGLHWLVLATCLAGLSACASPESGGIDPLNTIPPVLQQVANAPVAAGSSACEPDITLPEPLSLSESITHALCNHPQTRQAWEWVLQEAAAVGVARGAYLPTVSASAGIARVRQHIDYSDQPGLSSDLSARSTRMGASLAWVLYDFGLRAANLSKARHQLEAAIEARNRDIQRVLQETAQAYYALQSAQALLSAYRDSKSLAKHSLDVAHGRYQEGVGSLSDRLLAQTQLSEARLLEVEAEGGVQQARGRLASILGLPLTTIIKLEDISDEGTVLTGFSDALEAVLEAALQANPEIRMAQAQLAVARAELDAAVAQGLPSISLVGTVDRQSTPIERVSSRQVIQGSSVGVQIQIPLFSGFVNQYERRRAVAGVHRSERELDEVRRRVALEFWEGYQALVTQTQTLEISADLVENARKSFDVARGRYSAGVGSMLELLTAQSDVTQARHTYIAQLAAWYDARVYLAARMSSLNVLDLP